MVWAETEKSAGEGESTVMKKIKDFRCPVIGDFLAQEYGCRLTRHRASYVINLGGHIWLCLVDLQLEIGEGEQKNRESDHP